MPLPTSSTQDTRIIRPYRKFEGHAHWVRGFIHLPGGQRAMTCSDDGSLRVWNVQNASQIANNWQDGESGVCAMALSPDGNRVVSGGFDCMVRLWDIDTGDVIAKWTGHTKYVTSVCWSRDGGRVVSGSEDCTARVWDVESGHTVLTIKAGVSVVYAVAYSQDGAMIAIGGNSKENDFLNIWDANTGKLVSSLRGHTGTVNCLAWTADGTTLISGSFDYSIRTWNTVTWEQIKVLTGHTHSVEAFTISPNRRILASASIDKTAQLWNLETGQPIGSPLEHADSVLCVSFSTDGKLLATGCMNNNAYSWDVAGEAGLNEPLLNSNAHATRRPSQRHELPRGFFESPRHPHPCVPHSLPPSSTRQRHVVENGRALISRVSSLFRRRNDERIELQEPRPAVVDVPLTRGKHRNISGAQVRMKKEKENTRNAKNAKTAKNASASSSRPPQNIVIQQSGSAAQTSPSSELHAAVSTSSTAPSTAITRGTRFWSAICCTSAQSTEGHH